MDKRLPLQFRGHTIHLRKIVSGHETSIILIHGLGVSGDYYLAFAQTLKQYYDVYIVDLPGYGKTPKPKRPLTIKQLADIVVDFAASITSEKVVIMGQSMGSQIVAHAITDRPDLFQKAVLLAPTSNMNERTVLLQGFRLWQDTFLEPLTINMIVFTNYIRMGVRRFLITSRYMVDDHIEQTLQKNTVPLLIIRGVNDKIVPQDWTNYLIKITPFSKFESIAEAAHLLHYKKPARLTELCRIFIAS